jgi:uncharacterized repeat protein (TIGR01451 family)
VGLLSLLFAAPAVAQTYEISWHTVDGGGATFSTGGPYSLGATIGQPDASAALTGGSFGVVGGFWGGAGATQADLSITKTDGQTTAIPGQPITYTIVASNAGPSGVFGATVSDVVPAAVTGAAWTCLGSGGGTCAANGSGNIADTVNLPTGGGVTYTLTGTIHAAASGSLVNTATIAAPGGVTDPNTGNNSVTDTDTLAVNGCGVMETVLMPDGRRIQDTIVAGGTRWFAANVSVDRSYSVELASTDGTSTPPGTLTVFSGDDACSGTSTVAVNDTAASEPGGNAAIRRLSFTATGTQTFRARLVNGSGTAVPVSVRWSETTLYSPAWSDNGSYDTYYNIQNTTAATVHVALTLVDTTGVVVTTANLTIPAGRDVSANTLALSTPRNKTGTARLSHDGPPGAIVAGVAVASYATTPAYVQAVKFRTMRESR